LVVRQQVALILQGEGRKGMVSQRFLFLAGGGTPGLRGDDVFGDWKELPVFGQSFRRETVTHERQITAQS